MKRAFILILALILIIACQVIPTPPPLKATQPGGSLTQSRIPPTQGTPQTLKPSPVSDESLPTSSAPGELPPFPYKPGSPFTSVEARTWSPSADSQVEVSLPIPLGEVANLDVAAGMTSRQRAFLAKNGFVVIRSSDKQFNEIREQVATIYGQPYYLTSDAAYHALHLAFDETLEALEREELRLRMIAILQATLDEVISYIPLVQGTFLEADARLAAAYLGVGLKLFDPGAALDPILEAAVNAQVEQIKHGSRVENSVLMPSFKDDYSAYQPTGHYAGEPDLEEYFQGMTWFGRVYFKPRDQDPGFVPSRAPLIITLALRRASIDGESAAQEWSRVHEALTFLIGPSDDNGPAQYAPLMDQVFNRNVTILGLGENHLWRDLLTLIQELPPPEINSTFVNSLDDLDADRGWRFMGQRFNLDSFIQQNLIYDKVGTPDNKRELPSGLDVMAVLGSPAAMQTLEEVGETAYPNFPEQLDQMQKAIQTQSEDQWMSGAYNVWLYAFLPQVGGKPEAFPPYMRTNAWAYKDLNSALGSWAELKHDTTLFVKAPEMIAGDGAPTSGPGPGYVEPNPTIFYRLAYVASATAEGLRDRDMVGISSGDPISLATLVDSMSLLGEHLQGLGDIAVKELAGHSLDESDYWLIQSPLGPADERAASSKLMSVHGDRAPITPPPVELITTVAGARNRMLHVGLGSVDRIYVVVPIDGELQIAQGGLFSYYEFPWPRDERLNDSEWRQLLALTPLDHPEWNANYILPDGNPVDLLVFRIGDVYRITPAGDDLNLRAEPSRSAEVIRQLAAGEYIEIVDGPVQAESFTWWKIKLDLNAEEPVEGWAIEQESWYERAWGQ